MQCVASRDRELDPPPVAAFDSSYAHRRDAAAARRRGGAGSRRRRAPGNGASMCAIDNGRSVASTMGFTAVRACRWAPAPARSTPASCST